MISLTFLTGKLKLGTEVCFGTGGWYWRQRLAIDCSYLGLGWDLELWSVILNWRLVLTPGAGRWSWGLALRAGMWNWGLALGLGSVVWYWGAGIWNLGWDLDINLFEFLSFGTGCWYFGLGFETKG